MSEFFYVDWTGRVSSFSNLVSEAPLQDRLELHFLTMYLSTWSVRHKNDTIEHIFCELHVSFEALLTETYLKEKEHAHFHISPFKRGSSETTYKNAFLKLIKWNEVFPVT